MEDRVPHIYAHFADVVFDPRESATIRGQAAAFVVDFRPGYSTVTDFAKFLG